MFEDREISQSVVPGILMRSEERDIGMRDDHALDHSMALSNVRRADALVSVRRYDRDFSGGDHEHMVVAMDLANHDGVGRLPELSDVHAFTKMVQRCVLDLREVAELAT